MHLISVKRLKSHYSIFFSWPRSKIHGRHQSEIGSGYSLNLFQISKLLQMCFPASKVWLHAGVPFFSPTVILNLEATTFLNTFTFLLPCPSNCAFITILFLCICTNPFPQTYFYSNFK